VKIPTREIGVRLIEKQELLPGVYCGTSLGECNGEFVSCLVANLTTEPVMTLTLPKLITPPCKFERLSKEQLFSQQRLDEFNKKLRLSHVKESVRELCEEYVDIFKLQGDKLTATTAAMHHIPTYHFPKGRAVTLKNYRLAETHKEEVNRQGKQMLEDGIIVPSTSEWNFPVIVVPKKLDASGKKKWRICVDFRKLNDIAIGDSFPLPNIQEILDNIRKSKYISALDCASGFHQILITPEDRCKTALSTPSGHFEYVRMPFGLKAAPATFQRMMNSLLRESIGERCLVNMDDV
jgi:hypothetical protein